MRGPEALTTLLGQLEGWEAPAAAWESELLPARMENYEPLWLDQLSQAGRCRWLRLGAREGAWGGSIRTTPIALINRIHLRHWRPEGASQPDASLSGDARRVFGALEACGALFLDELSARAGLTPALAEAALAELVRCGLVSSDGFAGLRGLLVPARDKQRFKGLDWGLENAGRWSLFESGGAHEQRLDPDGRLAYVVRKLLLRYGILFRSLCARERTVPPWPDLLPVLRRLAGQGEIRAGHFVSSPDGEQFALPDAITSLRALRPANDEADIMVAASDPLNLAGILFATDRVPNDLGTWVVFRRGVPVAMSDRSGQCEDLSLSAASGLV
jgi:ATP-dependent Lhr-like helicase